MTVDEPGITDDLDPPPPRIQRAVASRTAAPRPRQGRRTARREARSVDLSCALVDGFAWQYGSEIVWDLQRNMAMKVAALRLLAGFDAVKIWLGNDKRRVVMPDDIVFDPTGSAAPQCVNLFGGIVLQPTAGDVKPILALLDHVCGGDEATRAFVLKWLALPLQRLGAKMRTALVVHGPEGSGKNLLFEIVRDIYGEYGLVVGQDQLEDRFNDWLSRKLFIIGDEVVTRQELRHHKGRLKALVSGREIQINTKMMPLRKEGNYVNLVFLSNEYQPLELDASDRRYCVLWTPAAKPKDFYDQVGKCIAAGGREAFYHYLLQLDLGDFDEFAPPQTSEAKQALIDVGLRPPERFLREWLGALLPLPVRPCAAEQLFRAYRRWCTSTGVRWAGEQAMFTNSLRKAGSQQLDYKVVNVPEDRGRKSTRCWIPKGTGNSGEQSVGAWVADAIATFEYDLRRFTETSEAPP